MSFREPWQCELQVRDNTLQQVERFKYLGVLFTSEWRQNKTDTYIGRANAVLRKLIVPSSQKGELLNTTKLSDFKLVPVPILTYSHEQWVVNERVLSQLQVKDIRFLQSSRREAFQQSVHLWNLWNDECWAYSPE